MLKKRHSGFSGCLLKIDVCPTGRARFARDDLIADVLVEEPDDKDPVSEH